MGSEFFLGSYHLGSTLPVALLGTSRLQGTHPCEPMFPTTPNSPASEAVCV